MIDYVRGIVAQVNETHVVVDVGGIGLRVQAAPGTVAELHVGEKRELPTSLVVREDAWTLYGFTTRDDREVFELVQSVTGIGPRTAQALVATLGSNGLRAAVAHEDTAALMRVPGIGKRGAQRLLVELADRLGAPAQLPGAPPAPAPDTGWQTTVLAGLTSLGWSSREAEAAVKAVAPQADSGADVATLLKAALRELHRS